MKALFVMISEAPQEYFQFLRRVIQVATDEISKGAYSEYVPFDSMSQLTTGIAQITLSQKLLTGAVHLFDFSLRCVRENSEKVDNTAP